ncbi:MAG: Trigger factor [Verrucomicrobiota bacterium]
MNVTLEHLGPCKKLLRVVVETDAVEAVFDTVTKDYVKYARLPGFRQGKAPRHLVAKAFDDRIKEDVRRRLVSDNLRKALEGEKLHVVGAPDVEEIHFAKGEQFQFAATVETAPEFELPEYSGIPLKKEVRSVTEEDINRAVELLREQRATYVDVERAIQEGDFAVVDYKGTCEGKPITEWAPTAKGLTERQDFWLQITPESFIPGFTQPLVGAKAGDVKTVELQFPDDFVAKEVAGKQGVFEVTVKFVKEKALPELNDEFAQAYGAENVDTLTQGVRRDLENELSYKLRRSTRGQLEKTLLERVQCELPESVVERETRNVVYNIVRENTERGVAREVIDQQKDQIFTHASSSAKDRVRLAFILGRIAEKEGIQATREEISQRIMYLAHQYNMKPEKLVKQLQERGGIEEIQEQIICNKVLDFIEEKAAIEEVLPPSGTPA